MEFSEISKKCNDKEDVPGHHDRSSNHGGSSHNTANENVVKSHDERFFNIERSESIDNKGHSVQADSTFYKDPDQSLEVRHGNSGIKSIIQKNEPDQQSPASFKISPAELNSRCKYQSDLKENTCTQWSPASLPSPGSSKSDKHRRLGVLNRSSDHISTLTSHGLRIPSTLSKSNHENRAYLPCGTSPGDYNAINPNVSRSHNTSMLSDGPVCRICHDGDHTEVLISPCYCAGSMGLLHVSCLQMWLGSSNKTSCEICNFKFRLLKRAFPITQFLAHPGSSRDKRDMILYMLNILLVTPLIITLSGFLCHHASKVFPDKPVEKYAVIGLAIALMISYSLAAAFSMRQIYWLYKDWKMFHQEVILLCKQGDERKQDNDHVQGQSTAPISDIVCSRSTLGSIILQEIKVSVTGRLTRYKPQQKGASTTKGRKRQLTDGLRRTSDYSSIHRIKGGSRSKGSTLSINQRNTLDQIGHFQRQRHGTGSSGRQFRERIIKSSEHAGKLWTSNRSDGQSRHSSKYSSVCSSNRDKTYRKPLRRLDENTDIIQYLYLGDSGMINLPNESKIVEGPFTYNNKVRTRRRCDKTDFKQVEAGVSKNIFSRGGSPDNYDTLHKQHLSCDDFVTKWVNDQKIVENSGYRHIQCSRDARIICHSNAREEIICEVVPSISNEFDECNNLDSTHYSTASKEHVEGIPITRSDTIHRTINESHDIKETALAVRAPVKVIHSPATVVHAAASEVHAPDTEIHAPVTVVHAPVTLSVTSSFTTCSQCSGTEKGNVNDKNNNNFVPEIVCYPLV